MKSWGRLAAAAMMLAGAGGAMAQEVELRGKRAGDFMIGLGAVGVLPTNGGSVGTIGGTPNASNAASPLLDGTYFFTPNIALNLIAATTRHKLTVTNSALGTVNLGTAWALPPTLTVQYHLMPQSRISPYVGVGLNTTFYYGYGGNPTTGINRVRIDPSVGVAPNIGVDYEIAPNWLANFDLKWILMQPDVSVNSGFVRARADINPFVISAALRYRF
ncbi:OmpW/AlkL family protein [Sediminicoccus rosea]|jgi:outer membrane protein|uniref:OmpW family outer membrane protein n=1 Tax=Sediminicoccus rosea TaxID=1225128 RepID=A0ABZ0PMC5_9PROT|nr:OmpW family outer membrane protein [Sediminicoccus rosea]WPB86617.1 OmpW family outer membrane protein [Sediminicoccus rosea]